MNTSTSGYLINLDAKGSAFLLGKLPKIYITEQMIHDKAIC